MGTRSTIWIENEDGSATGIYCHWDGYPSGVGATLLQHYNTKRKVEQLIALGGISVLDDKLTPPSGKNDFDNRIKPYTLAYHRDRGEELQQLKAPAPCKEVPTYKLFTGCHNMFEAYNYIFKNNKWHFIENDIELTEDTIAVSEM